MECEYPREGEIYQLLHEDFVLSSRGKVNVLKAGTLCTVIRVYFPDVKCYGSFHVIVLIEGEIYDLHYNGEWFDWGWTWSTVT